MILSAGPMSSILAIMERRDIAALADTSLFRGIGAVELDELFGKTPIVVREFRAGSLMLAAGSVYDSLWILVEGSVAAEMRGPTGKTLRIETIQAPEPLASAFLFAPEPLLPVTVRSLAAVRVVCIPRESLLVICQRSRAFLENYLRDAGSRLAALSERFRIMHFSALRGRLADWMLRHETGAGKGEVLLPASKEKMAETFGVTRPSLSREFSAMARDGLISVEGRRIAILRRDALAALAEPD
jgi:CRP/FNR family transcriptional regulator, dissimilatory nitrate respiration regulator